MTIRVKVGKPIPTDTPDASRDVLIQRVRDAIIDMDVEIGGPGGDKSLAIAGESKGA
ncbi:hypothetical protein D3C83_264510 [compost metagenome]